MMRQRERLMLKRGPASPGKAGIGFFHNSMSAVHLSLSGVEGLLDLQRTHGRAFVQRLLQRKFLVRGAGDQYAQDAD